MWVMLRWQRNIQNKRLNKRRATLGGARDHSSLVTCHSKSPFSPQEVIIELSGCALPNVGGCLRGGVVGVIAFGGADREFAAEVAHVLFVEREGFVFKVARDVGCEAIVGKDGFARYGRGGKDR